ncbi:MAG: putative tRNA threonylcarbamoyladenosine biosynthesis protein Gcp [Candidatus Curtissbacteria bacterium GW2011_GWA1_40_16]|uniref:tRNA N6-adenosine threonylcarbamoyltransferase n=1 Tax=Candidatus Curtissbacteria bacterium GW2011_GWA1_40_16 TaxID=1618405 RepID=A0A0G0TV47_9BACT|nr:MAG: putative tRNA threonylcarbamoyladenosine biosynthesis protein Gcp [Candidatus Curtissbacteria bacterium GW2011_GWA1_40_16]
MNILGIESTCDETGVAVVENGTKVLSSALATSVFEQAKYGGIVPEIAAREQLKVIIPTLNNVLKSVPVGTIDAVAVSYGPGLIGSLLVGVETAKSLASAWNKPLIPVNHLSAHIYSNWIDEKIPPKFPLVGLVISGGHTDLVYMKKHGDFKLIGSTLDDAAGEAFDKVARFLGLPYPGGPQIEKRAKMFSGIKSNVTFPRSMLASKDLNFSFSGIKTAVVQFVEKHEVKLTDDAVCEISFQFEQAIVDSIVVKVKRAIGEYKANALVVGGGVSANTRLRERLRGLGVEGHVKVHFPKKEFSVDNGAMIASAAFFTGRRHNPLSIQAESGLHFS